MMIVPAVPPTIAPTISTAPPDDHQRDRLAHVFAARRRDAARGRSARARALRRLASAANGASDSGLRRSGLTAAALPPCLPRTAEGCCESPTASVLRGILRGERAGGGDQDGKRRR